MFLAQVWLENAAERSAITLFHDEPISAPVQLTDGDEFSILTCTLRYGTKNASECRSSFLPVAANPAHNTGNKARSKKVGAPIDPEEAEIDAKLKESLSEYKKKEEGSRPQTEPKDEQSALRQLMLKSASLVGPVSYCSCAHALLRLG
jgi:hypothetical protein